MGKVAPGGIIGNKGALLMADVLIAEDEKNIGDVLKDILEGEAHDVRLVHDGKSAIAAFAEKRPDIVVLDVMMPGMNGFDACAAIRKTDLDVPILFLTARNEEIDKVRGLGLGADDYLTKPFGTYELVARVSALLRRAARSGGAAERRKVDVTPFVIAGHEVDPARLTMKRLAAGREISITPHDVNVLRVFADNPDVVLSRDQLIEKGWNMRFGATTRTVDMEVLKLRKLLGADSRHIETVRCGGYRYRTIAQ